MTLREFLAVSGIFDEAWYRRQAGIGAGEDAIAHWIEHGRAAMRGPNAMIDGLRGDRPPAAEGEASPTWDLDAEIAFLRASGVFVAQEYLRAHPDVASTGMDPLAHFCRYGWKELRAPGRGFDTWWYWNTYLDPTRECINPLLHFALFATAGLATAPPRVDMRPGTSFSPGVPVRRICLFAGYDPDGLVDDYVVAYLEELSRHADVYYLADCALRPGQLEKLASCTKGAWAERHGAYDFGSWSRLATTLVGWEEIDRYDELILANDSCYLLRPLDGVFARMDRRPCDWWGMQATKQNFDGDEHGAPVPLSQVAARGLLETEPVYIASLHLSSYFLSFRRPVLEDPGFRRRLGEVVPQTNKTNIIRKYEVGLSRHLIARGFAFDTFANDLHPYHPVYSSVAFDLAARGFPLFKRFMLTDNPRRVPGLLDWKERLLSRVPGADVGMMERNLLRVADNEKLYRNLRVTLDEEGRPEVPEPLDEARVARLDRELPKFDHWWAFPVCAFDGTLAGNERAVFEEVKADPSIRKVVLTRSRHVAVDGENVVVVPLRSAEGQSYLMRCRQVFVKHSPRVNVPYGLSPRLHNFINLWHGIPIKRFGYASLDMADKLGWLREENPRNRAVIASSKVDMLAMAAAFHPLSYLDIWPTGLPRNDFILRAEEALPADLRAELRRLRAEVGGRRLLLFAPTFRNAQEAGTYAFDKGELAFLADWCWRHNAVIGVREHMADQARGYSRQLAPLGALDLSSARYPDIEMLYRVADVLVSDYSSCMVDFMLTGKPIVSFAYDHDRYAGSERGLFYDLEFAVAGPVCRDFGQLRAALEAVFDADGQEAHGYEWKRRMFFDHLDDHNAWRVVERVMGLYAARTSAGAET